MLFETLRALHRKPAEIKLSDGAAKTPLYIQLERALPWHMHFEKSGITVSPLLPLALGFFVGIISAIMGLGGGFIMVPLMFYLLHMPMHLVVGTNLFQEAFLCANVTIMQAFTNHVVDVVLAFTLLVGSSIGAQFGARFSRRLHADQLRLFLAVLILLVMVKIFLGLVLSPQFMLDMKGGQ